eukprot:6260357-Pyramimonas_sp.AAC.1
MDAEIGDGGQAEVQLLHGDGGLADGQHDMEGSLQCQGYEQEWAAASRGRKRGCPLTPGCDWKLMGFVLGPE